MRIQRLLIAAAATALVAAACSTSPAAPAGSGPGWKIVDQKPNGLWPALRLSVANERQLLVSVVVSGGCPEGGPATPTFTGFAEKGDEVQALVTRIPIPASASFCLVHAGTEFDVLLDLDAVPSSASAMVLGGDACPVGDDLCAAVVVRIPAVGLASPGK